MADPTTPPADSPVFQQLVARYGLQGAITLWPIFSGGATTRQKAMGGASLATSGAQIAGKVGGSPGLAALGGAGSKALGAAGVGLGIYDTATNEHLSTKQKAGHSNQLAGEAALSAFVPYAGLGVLAKHIIGAMEGSKSPQVSGVGKGLAYPARPVEGLLSVLSGDLSPRAAGNRMVAQARDTPGLKALINPVFDFFGLGTKPTTGTQFRNQVRSLFDQIPALRGTDTSQYNIDPTAYNSLSPQAREQALAIAGKLSPIASKSAANPEAYKIQLANILLNRFGNQIPAGL